MPEGLYKLTHQPVKRGDTVLLLRAMKGIIAVPGDLVEFNQNGFIVNGKPIPDSAPEAGYPHFQYGKYITPAGMVLCLGRHPDSFDARYFGFTAETLVESTVKPVWTYEGQ